MGPGSDQPEDRRAREPSSGTPAAGEQAKRDLADEETLVPGGRQGRGRPAPGRWVIGHYEVLDELGRGGMGAVFKARHVDLGHVVALKVVLGGELAGSKAAARFLREARTSAKLRHPNIVPLHDFGETPDGQHWFTMDYVEGQTLSARLGGRPLAGRRACELMQKVAKAVHYAHAQGVIHRDLKPANIMLSQAGEPLVMDFGLAKQADAATLTGQSIQGSPMGSVHYMPPEQASGELEKIDERSDVYSLGATFYEMLTGRAPFVAATTVEVLKQIWLDEPIPVRKLNPEVPADVETIVLKCLEKDPKHRYQSAEALAEDIRRHLAHEPILARPAGPLLRTVKFCRRHRLEVTAAAAVMLAVLAGLSVWAWQGRAKLRAQREAVRARQLNLLDRDLEQTLASRDWSPEGLERLDDIAQRVETLWPQKGADVRRRINDAFAAGIRTRLRRPSLGSSDVEELKDLIKVYGERRPAEAGTLGTLYERRLRTWQPVFDLNPPFESADDVFGAGVTQVLNGRLVTVGATVERYGPIVKTRVPFSSHARVEVVFDDAWRQHPAVGVMLVTALNDGYAFLLHANKPDPILNVTPGVTYRSLGEAIGQGTPGELAIVRNGIPVQRGKVLTHELRGPLRLTVSRERGSLVFQAGDAASVIFEDIFPLAAGQHGVFALYWPPGVGVLHFQAMGQALPEAPSPLERGDELYAHGRFAEACSFYRDQETTADEHELSDEVRYKQGLCLLALGQETDATEMLRDVAARSTGRWSTLALFQLWAQAMEKKDLEEADTILDALLARYQFSELATLISSGRRSALASAYWGGGRRIRDIMQPTPTTVGRLERAVALAGLQKGQFSGFVRAKAKVCLAEAYCAVGRRQAAVQLLHELFADTLREHDPRACDVAQMAWARVMRLMGQSEQAIAPIRTRLYGETGKLDPARARLLVALALLHVSVDQWQEAERQLETYFQVVRPRREEYGCYADAALALGYIREHEGDPDGAREAWRLGTPASFRAQIQGDAHDKRLWEDDEGGAERILDALILLALSGDLTDEAALELLELGIDAKKGDSLLSTVSKVMRFPVAPLRTMWHTERGGRIGRQIAFQSEDQATLLRRASALYLFETVRLEAFGGNCDADEQELLWETIQAAQEAIGGKLDRAQIIQGALAWEGMTGFLGWHGLAPKLDPDLRSQVAYVLAHRYERLKRPKDAAALLETAYRDGPEGSLVRRLAQKEIEKRKGALPQ
jgi:hypothetical protein